MKLLKLAATVLTFVSGSSVEKKQPAVIIQSRREKVILEKLYQGQCSFLKRAFLTLPFLSKMVGWGFDLPLSKPYIKTFLKQHPHLMEHADEFDNPNGDITAYRTFNDFFCRKLSAKGRACRPLDHGPDVVTSPADCNLFVVPTLNKNAAFYVKECPFNLETFLGGPRDAEARRLAQEYNNGTLLLLRLSPDDYHRFHFPFDCIPGKPRVISGRLESVNPIAYTPTVQPLSTNLRHVMILKSDFFGEVICVAVGAMMVGSIIETYTPGQFYQKGHEMGYFAFGGSTVVLIFKRGVVEVERALASQSSSLLNYEKTKGQFSLGSLVNYPESPIKMGQRLATKVKKGLALISTY